MIDPKVAGKTALITGTNNQHGTGAAIALALAAQGVKVCLHFFRSHADTKGAETMGEDFYNDQQSNTADWLVDKIKNGGGEAVSIEADLADVNTVPLLFDKAETLGPVEILINNAAYCLQDTLSPQSQGKAVDGFSLSPFSAESHDRHFAVNSRAVALSMQEFAQRHTKRDARWGRIVNISSDGAPIFPTQVSYGASKYALESFSRSAAKELGYLGITVNIASLGPIQTGWIAPDLEKEIAKSTPLGRVGEPNDVADVVTFLTSEQAGWLTGQILYVGGGHRII